MENTRTIILAPHDDGGGAFAVLCRLARALVHMADEKNYQLHLYFLNSSSADGGQERLNDLTRGLKGNHEAIFVPTDNLIRLPKDRETATVAGAQIPDMLKKRVRPLWHSWPCEPDWSHQNLSITKDGQESNILPGMPGKAGSSNPKAEKALTECGSLRKLRPQLWKDVALGISMGVPQLHRVACREGFPSVEFGDWFFSVGLRGCMQESQVLPEVIAATEPDLKMIEEDELKAREVWLTLHQAPRHAYMEYLAGSPVKLRIMAGAMWSGDPLPAEGILNWRIARDLRKEINLHIARIRGVAPGHADHIHVAYIVMGKTGVWDNVVARLRKAQKRGTQQVAIIDLDRSTGTIIFLEDGGRELGFTSAVLQQASGEERHLATCRASDLGITRSAGGVLGFAETQRPSVFVDEPGHWLGRIQREQCHEAGLCVVIPAGEFLKDPSSAIQGQADKLGKGSDLDQTVKAVANMPVGAERDLVGYLFKTYIE